MRITESQLRRIVRRMVNEQAGPVVGQAGKVWDVNQQMWVPGSYDIPALRQEVAAGLAQAQEDMTQFGDARAMPGSGMPSSKAVLKRLESFANAALDAMAKGKPCSMALASRYDSLDELIALESSDFLPNEITEWVDSAYSQN